MEILYFFLHYIYLTFYCYFLYIDILLYIKLPSQEISSTSTNNIIKVLPTY